MQDNISVHDLEVGQRAQITHLVGRTESLVRLGEIGFRAGAAITMVRTGPACIVRLGATKLCIRPVDVDVRVRPNEPIAR